MEAGIRGTQRAEEALNATVEARVSEALATTLPPNTSPPTPTLVLTVAPTPTPNLAPTQTPTVPPTPTPMLTPTPTSTSVHPRSFASANPDADRYGPTLTTPLPPTPIVYAGSQHSYTYSDTDRHACAHRYAGT